MGPPFVASPTAPMVAAPTLGSNGGRRPGQAACIGRAGALQRCGLIFGTVIQGVMQARPSAPAVQEFAAATKERERPNPPINRAQPRISVLVSRDARRG